MLTELQITGDATFGNPGTLNGRSARVHVCVASSTQTTTLPSSLPVPTEFVFFNAASSTHNWLLVFNSTTVATITPDSAAVVYPKVGSDRRTIVGWAVRITTIKTP